MGSDISGFKNQGIPFSTKFGDGYQQDAKVYYVGQKSEKLLDSPPFPTANPPTSHVRKE
jgi:hypothetical protein